MHRYNSGLVDNPNDHYRRNGHRRCWFGGHDNDSDNGRLHGRIQCGLLYWRGSHDNHDDWHGSHDRDCDRDRCELRRELAECEFDVCGCGC